MIDKIKNELGMSGDEVIEGQNRDEYFIVLGDGSKVKGAVDWVLQSPEAKLLGVEVDGNGVIVIRILYISQQERDLRMINGIESLGKKMKERGDDKQGYIYELMAMIYRQTYYENYIYAGGEEEGGL